mmetsp:Transcript_16099/g.39215  ORF Transcript_16099/g.39215 Transcript_16099/m.39215 type:complete len:284 (-) Transcript_16099:393-1244(-)
MSSSGSPSLCFKNSTNVSWYRTAARCALTAPGVMPLPPPPPPLCWYTCCCCCCCCRRCCYCWGCRCPWPPSRCAGISEAVAAVPSSLVRFEPRHCTSPAPPLPCARLLLGPQSVPAVRLPNCTHVLRLPAQLLASFLSLLGSAALTVGQSLPLTACACYVRRAAASGDVWCALVVDRLRLLPACCPRLLSCPSVPCLLGSMGPPSRCCPSVTAARLMSRAACCGCIAPDGAYCPAVLPAVLPFPASNTPSPTLARPASDSNNSESTESPFCTVMPAALPSRAP